MIPPSSRVTRILGIDPGSMITGYGVIESDGYRNRYLHHGHIRVKGSCLGEKLRHIFTEVTAVAEQWQPQEVAVEQVFVSKNAQTALKLGQARGAALCAAVGTGASLAEYAPRLIKKTVTGTGTASKEQMQHMVSVLLRLSEKPQADAADALAIALCHGQMRHSPILQLQQQGVKV